MTTSNHSSRPVAILALVLTCVVCRAWSAEPGRAELLPAPWRGGWVEPPAADRPRQMQHALNPKLATLEGMRHFKDLGLGGIVTNVPFEQYMQSEAHWQTLINTVDACKQLGMTVWIYDEVGYPSGAAGGLVLARDRSFEAQELAYDASRAGDAAFILRPAYEYTHASNNYHAARRYANLIDPRAVDCFIDVTHEAYFKRLKPYFGSTIEAFFTDEPSLIAVNMGQIPEAVRVKVKVQDPVDASVASLPCVPWTADLPEQYRKRYGQDLAALRQSLFTGDAPADRQVRRQFWALIGELTCDRYFGGLGRWCAAHGVASSGHTLSEESLIHHVPLEGNAIKALCEMQIPGMDMLSSDAQIVNHSGWLTAGLPTSAALLRGGRRAMTEISDFSQTMSGKGPATIDQMRAAAAWQAAWGVTEFNLYYRPEVRADDDYRAYGVFIGRLNSILKPAARDPKVLLYYPVCDLWPEYRPVAEPLRVNTQSQRAQQVVASFNRLGQALQRSQVTFCLIDHEHLAAAQASGTGLKVAGHEFTTLLVPQGCELPVEAATVVAAFERSGGRVLRDGDGAAKLTLATIARATGGDCHPMPASEQLAIGRFVRDGRRVLVIVNVGAQPYDGSLTQAGAPMWLALDPANGEAKALAADKTGALRLALGSQQTVVLVEERK